MLTEKLIVNLSQTWLVKTPILRYVSLSRPLDLFLDLVDISEVGVEAELSLGHDFVGLNNTSNSKYLLN